jgi:hypothetical protein
MRLNKDKLAGLLLMLLGLGAVLEGRAHSIGSLTQMGSGYFPVALGLILLGIGFLILVTAAPESEEKPLSALIGADDKETAHLSLDHCPPPDWRGISCIIVSIVGFIVIGHYLGLVPATFASVFVAALGDRTASLREALVLGLVMCALAIGLFHYVLHIQFPLFQFPLWKA